MTGGSWSGTRRSESARTERSRNREIPGKELQVPTPTRGGGKRITIGRPVHWRREAKISGGFHAETQRNENESHCRCVLRICELSNVYKTSLGPRSRRHTFRRWRRQDHPGSARPRGRFHDGWIENSCD